MVNENRMQLINDSLKKNHKSYSHTILLINGHLSYKPYEEFEMICMETISLVRISCSKQKVEYMSTTQFKAAVTWPTDNNLCYKEETSKQWVNDKVGERTPFAFATHVHWG
jgi:hypothetical protein